MGRGWKPFEGLGRRADITVKTLLKEILVRAQKAERTVQKPLSGSLEEHR